MDMLRAPYSAEPLQSLLSAPSLFCQRTLGNCKHPVLIPAINYSSGQPSRPHIIFPSNATINFGWWTSLWPRALPLLISLGTLSVTTITLMGACMPTPLACWRPIKRRFSSNRLPRPCISCPSVPCPRSSPPTPGAIVMGRPMTGERSTLQIRPSACLACPFRFLSR